MKPDPRWMLNPCLRYPEGVAKGPEGPIFGPAVLLSYSRTGPFLGPNLGPSGPFVSPASRQAGLTLMMVLIMLLLITLVSITAFKLSNNNLQVVNNMQLRNQTMAAAQAAIENVISQPTFTTAPNVPVTTYASVGGSTTNDIQVVTTPTCVQIQPIPTSALNLNDPNDIGCVIGVGQQNGVVGTNGPNSMCANSVWDIQAVATDLSTNTQSTIHQGVAVRVPITATCP